MRCFTRRLRDLIRGPVLDLEFTFPPRLKPPAFARVPSRVNIPSRRVLDAPRLDPPASRLHLVESAHSSEVRRSLLRGLLLLLALSSLGDRGAFVFILGLHVFLFLLLLLARGVASFLRGAAALLGGIRGLVRDDEIILKEKLNRLELGVRFPPDPDPGLFPSTLELLELG